MLSGRHASEIFSHFFQHNSSEIKEFRKTVWPLLDHQWVEHIDEIIVALKKSKDQMKESVYRECIEATQRYVNSRDFAVPGRYEVKKSWFFSGIQYYGETSSFQKLNKCLTDLLAEVPQPKTSWAETLWSSWSSLVSSFSSAADFASKNPMKVACSFLALEAVAVSALTKPHILSDNHFDSMNDPHSLSTGGSSPIVNGQIPDQLLNVGDAFELKINTTELFGEPVTDVMVSQADGSPLPDWLNASPTIVGGLRTEGAQGGIVLNNSLAYVADGSGGLKIIDVSDYRQPLLLGNLSIPYAGAIAISGNTAYVVDCCVEGSYKGLRIIDVCNASQPMLLGSLPISHPGPVAINDKTAYVLDSNESLEVIDVSNVSQPILRGSFPINGGDTVIVKDKFVYLTDRDGLKIIGVDNPSQPVLKGSLVIDAANGLAINGNLAYVLGGKGLSIIDISNATHPLLKGSWAELYLSGKVAISGNTAYVTYIDGLKMIDISDSAHPILKGNLVYPLMHGIVVTGNFLYVISDHKFSLKDDLEIIDLSFRNIYGVPDKSKQKYNVLINAKTGTLQTVTRKFFISTDCFPIAINTIRDQSMWPGETLKLHFKADSLFQDRDVSDTLGLGIQLDKHLLPTFLQFQLTPFIYGDWSMPSEQYPDRVKINANIAYLLAGEAGLIIIDVSNPHLPILKGNFTTGHIASDFAIDGYLAYVTDFYGLSILDVSDPNAPALKGYLPITYNARGVALSGYFAYIALAADGLMKIVDVSNSTQPVLKGSLPSPTPCYYEEGIVVNGNFVYVGDHLGLKVIDVSNVTQPVLTGAIDSPGAYRIAENRNFAYVANDLSAIGSLSVIDISNASQPILKGNILINTAKDVVVSGNLAYVAGLMGGLQIIDISNASQPILRGSAPTIRPSAIALSGNFAYLTNYNYRRDLGLKVVDITNYQFTASPSRSDEGNYEIVVVATDPDFVTASVPFTLRVEGAPRLMKPLPSQMALIGQQFSCFVPQGTFWDPNNDIITYEADAQTLPSFCSFNPSSVTFLCTPGDADMGNYTITISASDRMTTPTPANFHLLVHHAPTLNTPIPKQVANIGQPFSFTVPADTFEDMDKNPLTYSAIQIGSKPWPSWLHFFNQTVTFWGMPQESDQGDSTLSVIADDGLQGRVSGSFDLKVEHFPRLVQPIGSVYAAVGHTFTFNAFSYFKDEDGESLQFSATSNGKTLPRGLTLDINGCKFSGTPEVQDKGIIPINLIASDPWSGKVEVLFNLTVDDYTKVVHAPNPLGVTIGNQPPSLTDPLLKQSATAGVAIEFSVKNAFKDPDGDQLRYMANLGEAADWLKLDETTGRFSGIPSNKDAATYSTRRYTIGVTAMDPANEAAAGSFEVQLLGPSLTEKILNAIWVASGLAIAFYGYYQKKYLFWNCCRRSQYKKPDLYIGVGQTGTLYQVGYPSERIKSIIVTTIKDRCCIKRESCCMNTFKNTDEYNLPGRGRFYVFDWLLYDAESNKFQIIKNGPSEQYVHEDIEIQIRGADNRIMEQFTIKVRERNETHATIALLADESLEIGMEEKQASSSHSSSSASAYAPVSMSALSSASSSSSSTSALMMKSAGLFNSKQEIKTVAKVSECHPNIQSDQPSVLKTPLLNPA